jgi:hypothetical protein
MADRKKVLHKHRASTGTVQIDTVLNQYDTHLGFSIIIAYGTHAAIVLEGPRVVWRERTDNKIVAILTFWTFKIQASSSTDSIVSFGALRSLVLNHDDEDDRMNDEDASPSSLYHRPTLVASVTDDDEEDDWTMTLQEPKKTHHGAIGFLLRYETMARQQDTENVTTLAYMRPCMERLRELGGRQFGRGDDGLLVRDQVRYSDLKIAFETLKLQPSNVEFCKTDQQLMMVLEWLTQHETSDDATITWAEFLQAYKIAIVGMQTLQHLPMSSTARARAKDRTMAMLSLFDENSSAVLTNKTFNASVSGSAMGTSTSNDEQAWTDTASATEESSKIKVNFSSSQPRTGYARGFLLFIFKTLFLASIVVFISLSHDDLFTVANNANVFVESNLDQIHLLSMAHPTTDGQPMLELDDVSTAFSQPDVNAILKPLSVSDTHVEIAIAPSVASSTTNNKALPAALLGSIVGATGAPLILLQASNVALLGVGVLLPLLFDLNSGLALSNDDWSGME